MTLSFLTSSPLRSVPILLALLPGLGGCGLVQVRSSGGVPASARTTSATSDGASRPATRKENGFTSHPSGYVPKPGVEDRSSFDGRYCAVQEAKTSPLAARIAATRSQPDARKALQELGAVLREAKTIESSVEEGHRAEYEKLRFENVRSDDRKRGYDDGGRLGVSRVTLDALQAGAERMKAAHIPLSYKGDHGVAHTDLAEAVCVKDGPALAQRVKTAIDEVDAEGSQFVSLEDALFKMHNLGTVPDFKPGTLALVKAKVAKVKGGLVVKASHARAMHSDCRTTNKVTGLDKHGNVQRQVLCDNSGMEETGFSITLAHPELGLPPGMPPLAVGDEVLVRTEIVSSSASKKHGAENIDAWVNLVAKPILFVSVARGYQNNIYSY